MKLKNVILPCLVWAIILVASTLGYCLHLSNETSEWHVTPVPSPPRPRDITDALLDAAKGWPSQLARDEAASHSSSKDISFSTSRQSANVYLPKHVVAPEGKLSLIADYNDRRQKFIVLYVINKMNREVDMGDGTLPIKLHHRLPDGTWERAEGYVPEPSCGNSEHKLLPMESHYSILVYSPQKGQPAIVRYGFVTHGMPAIFSNEGEGYILEADVAASKLWP